MVCTCPTQREIYIIIGQTSISDLSGSCMENTTLCVRKREPPTSHYEQVC